MFLLIIITHIYSFNSTLVQLKADIANLYIAVVIEFQFYLSSIKSCINQPTNNTCMAFQFYLSSIKSFVKGILRR